MALAGVAQEGSWGAAGRTLAGHVEALVEAAIFGVAALHGVQLLVVNERRQRLACAHAAVGVRDELLVEGLALMANLSAAVAPATQQPVVDHATRICCA